MLQGYHGFVRPKHLIDSEEKRERREWFDSVMKKKDEESKTTQESKGGHAQRLGQKWKKAKTKGNFIHLEFIFLLTSYHWEKDL